MDEAGPADGGQNLAHRLVLEMTIAADDHVVIRLGGMNLAEEGRELGAGHPRIADIDAAVRSHRDGELVRLAFQGACFDGLGQVDLDAGMENRRHHHEDDEQHQADVDERGDVDFTADGASGRLR